jgi:hypothetical protein
MTLFSDNKTKTALDISVSTNNRSPVVTATASNIKNNDCSVSTTGATTPSPPRFFSAGGEGLTIVIALITAPISFVFGAIGVFGLALWIVVAVVAIVPYFILALFLTSLIVVPTI